MTSPVDTPAAEYIIRPYGAPPPKFKGKAEDDLEDWLRVYDRYAKALAWSGDQKADNLVVVLKQ